MKTKESNRKKSTGPELGVVAFAWYLPEQYALLRQCALDGPGLCPSFAEWEAQAESKFADMKAHGIPVVQIRIDVDELVAWCGKKGRPVDAAARAEFAAQRANGQSSQSGILGSVHQ